MARARAKHNFCTHALYSRKHAQLVLTHTHTRIGPKDSEGQTQSLDVRECVLLCMCACVWSCYMLYNATRVHATMRARVKCEYYIKCKCTTKVVAAAMATAVLAFFCLLFCQEVFGMTSKEQRPTFGPGTCWPFRPHSASRAQPMRNTDRTLLGQPVQQKNETNTSDRF